MSVAAYREMIAKEQELPRQTPQRKRTASGTSAAAPRNTPEEDLHRACFEWVTLQTARHPILQYLIHVPNGGARSKGEAGKLKAMGTKPGVPDFLLPRARGGWKGLAIELKSSIGKLSAEQKEWLRGLQQEGYLCSVCRNLDDFVALVQAFLNDKPSPKCTEYGW